MSSIHSCLTNAIVDVMCKIQIGKWMLCATQWYDAGMNLAAALKTTQCYEDRSFVAQITRKQKVTSTNAKTSKTAKIAKIEFCLLLVWIFDLVIIAPRFMQEVKGFVYVQ